MQYADQVSGMHDSLNTLFGPSASTTSLPPCVSLLLTLPHLLTAWRAGQ